MTDAAPHYTLCHAATSPALELDPHQAVWRAADTATIGHVHPQSSNFHPHATFRLRYDDTHLHGLFVVHDRYVVCRHTQLNSAVCQDSCVECFLQPGPDTGYLNVEFNCGGVLHASHILDATRTATGFADYRLLTAQEAAGIRVRTTLSAPLPDELREPTTWRLAFALPFDLLASICGPEARPQPGAVWRANLYTCADRSSHPRWLSWAPLPELNFHTPQAFAPLHFG